MNLVVIADLLQADATVGLSPLVKDILQAAAWLVAAIGGVVAALKAVRELAKSTAERQETHEIRERELRWRQAEVAKKVIDEVRTEPLARSALKMIDWSGLTYKRPDGAETVPLTTAFVARALRTVDATFRDLDEPFVRDCFDSLLDGLERLEHYVGIGLVLWTDVHPPFAYYVRRLKEQNLEDSVKAFAKQYGFDLASRFLVRFDAA